MNAGASVVQHHHQMMLKIVTKGFFNELTQYGVNRAEIITIASHLLDHLLEAGPELRTGPSWRVPILIGEVQDHWKTERTLSIGDISISPLLPSAVPTVSSWLKDPLIRDSFVPRFPVLPGSLAAYFRYARRRYFGVFFEGELSGIIGAEKIDSVNRKLEMRKLVNPAMQRRGIGKNATFLFLYYVFEILQYSKIYIHSRDVNIRNINLNNKLGFELEGVFFEDACVDGKYVDLVRMSLRAQMWRDLYSTLPVSAAVV